MKEFMIPKSSVMEIQNLFVDPKSQHNSGTLNNTNIYLSTFPAKINHKIFQNKKNYFGVIFAQSNFS